MAATMAVARGIDRTGRTKETHRLGSMMAETSAQTWRTFVRVIIESDGRYSVTVERDGRIIDRMLGEPE